MQQWQKSTHHVGKIKDMVARTQYAMREVGVIWKQGLAPEKLKRSCARARYCWNLSKKPEHDLFLNFNLPQFELTLNPLHMTWLLMCCSAGGGLVSTHQYEMLEDSPVMAGLQQVVSLTWQL